MATSVPSPISQTGNSNSLFYEYLTACRFYVGLTLDGSNDTVDAYFMECKGFRTNVDVVEFAEVFPQAWGRSGASRGRVIRSKIPGNTKINNINLRRGLGASMTMWNWVKSIQDGQWSRQYRNGSITIYQQNGVEGARFVFEGAWPISYTVSDTTVSSTDLGFEELEIACEVFERIL